MHRNDRRNQDEHHLYAIHDREREARFFAIILRTGIAGRAKAEDIEDEYIENYRKKHGYLPPGND